MFSSCSIASSTWTIVNHLPLHPHSPALRIDLRQKQPQTGSRSDSDFDSSESSRLQGAAHLHDNLLRLRKRIRRTAHADVDVSHHKIFVHGLGWDTTREVLVFTFEPFGEVEDSNLIMDKLTGKAKGYGFVLFKTRRAALKALREPKKTISSPAPPASSPPSVPAPTLHQRGGAIV
ncbi:hypothetical protein ACLB2K_011580 [Fragaria x ananassa]